MAETDFDFSKPFEVVDEAPKDSGGGFDFQKPYSVDEELRPGKPPDDSITRKLGLNREGALGRFFFGPTDIEREAGDTRKGVAEIPGRIANFASRAVAAPVIDIARNVTAAPSAEQEPLKNTKAFFRGAPRTAEDAVLPTEAELATERGVVPAVERGAIGLVKMVPHLALGHAIGGGPSAYATVFGASTWEQTRDPVATAESVALGYLFPSAEKLGGLYGSRVGARLKDAGIITSEAGLKTVEAVGKQAAVQVLANLVNTPEYLRNPDRALELFIESTIQTGAFAVPEALKIANPRVVSDITRIYREEAARLAQNSQKSILELQEAFRSVGAPTPKLSEEIASLTDGIVKERKPNENPQGNVPKSTEGAAPAPVQAPLVTEENQAGKPQEVQITAEAIFARNRGETPPDDIALLSDSEAARLFTEKADGGAPKYSPQVDSVVWGESQPESKLKEIEFLEQAAQARANEVQAETMKFLRANQPVPPELNTAFLAASGKALWYRGAIEGVKKSGPNYQEALQRGLIKSKETPVPPVAANQPAALVAPVVQPKPESPQPVAPPVQPPAVPAPQPTQPQPAAKRTTVVSSGKPNGSRVEVEYEIVEANEIRPLVVREVGADQTRQRVGNVASNEQIAQIATNPDINLLSDSPTSTVGAPIVDDAVIAGNGRLSGIIAGYDGGTRGSINYRRALIEKAKELGLGDISNMVMPVLIRRVKRYVSGDKRAFVVESNPQSAALKESVSEAALLDSDALGDLSGIEFNESGSLSAAGVSEVARRFQAAQRALTRTTGGAYDTSEANKRVQLAALAKIAKAENIPVGDFIGLLESEDGKRVISEVTKASPRMSALDGDLQIGGDIIRALRELHSGINAVSTGAFKSLDEWYAERANQLIKSELNVVGDAILKLMVGSQRSGAIMREFFNEYIRQAEYEQTQRKEAGASADIFGEARQPVTGEKIAGRILGVPESGAKDSPVSGAKPNPEVRPEVAAAERARKYNEAWKKWQDAVEAATTTEALDAALDGAGQDPERSTETYSDIQARVAEKKRKLASDAANAEEAARISAIEKLPPTERKAAYEAEIQKIYNGNLQSADSTGEAERWTNEDDRVKELRAKIAALQQQSGDFPARPSLPKSEGEVRPGKNIFSEFTARLDDWKNAIAEWLKNKPENKAIIWEEAEREINSRTYKGNVRALTRNIGDPKNPWRVTSYGERDGAYMPMGHQVYPTREAALAEEVRDYKTFHETFPGRVMDEQEIQGYKLMRDIPDKSKLVWYDLDKRVSPAALREKLRTTTNMPRFVRDSWMQDKIAFTEPIDGGSDLQKTLEWLGLKPSETPPSGVVEQAPKAEAPKEWSVGSKVQVKNEGPTLWTIVAETTDPKFPDERIFKIQNDKTGKASEYDMASLKPAKARTAEERESTKEKTKEELQNELLKLNPALRNSIKEFKTKAQLRDQIKREKAKRGPVADLGAGLPDGTGWTVDGVIAAVENEDLAGFNLNVITKDQAAEVTGRDEARGYGGFFYNDQVYLVADNIRAGNAESAKQILREEVAHGLLRTEEGLALLRQALNEGKLRLTKSERDALLAKGYKNEGNQLLDEFIAKSARENTKWWQDIVLAIKAFLSRAGLKLSNEDAARILLKQIRSKQPTPAENQIEAAIPASGSDSLSAEEIKRINRELNKLNAKATKTAQDTARIAELEAQLGQQDLFAAPVVERAGVNQQQRDEIARRQSRRLIAGQIEDQGGLFAPRGEEKQGDMFAAPPAPKTETPPKRIETGRAQPMDLFGDLAPSGADNPEFIRAQVGGVRGVGQVREVENIAEIRAAIKERVFNATPAVTDERTEDAWRIANELTDEVAKAGHALRYRNEIGGQEMGLPLLQNELFRYGFKLASSGDETFLRFMLDSSADFQTITGGGRTTSGRVQRAARELADSVAFHWLREAMDTERRNAAISGARILPQETFLGLVRDMENLQLNPDELEAFLNRAQGPNGNSFAQIVADAIGQGGAPQQPGAPRQPRGRGQQSPALPGFEDIVDSEAGREAARMLDRYQRSQTEWLNNAERRQSIVRIIVNEALGENRLARYGREDFINRLTERLREAEVPPAIARELAHEVWADKAAREATETARAQAGDENFEQRRAESILNRLQQDQTEWVGARRQSEAARLIREFLREEASGVSAEARIERLSADLVRAGVRESTARELAFQAGERKAAVQASARIQAQSMTNDQAQSTADGILRRLQDRHSGVEWLRQDENVNQVREIVRQALQGRLGYAEGDTRVDPILQDPTPIVEKIQQALEAVGVDAETARNLGREIETERQNRWANQRVRQMERASRSNSVRSLIEDILNTPYRAQHDPAWRRRMAIRWFESNGLSREQATAAADMFNREFTAAYQRAAEKVAADVLKNGRPRTDAQLERLIRSGVIDPSRHWADTFAEQTGWKKPTPEQFAKLAELEEKIADPSLSPPEQAAIREQQMSILRHVGKKDGAMIRALGESYVASLLSGIRTFFVQFSPMIHTLRDFPTMAFSDPKNALNFAKAIFNAYKKNFISEAKYAWQKDAFGFHINELERSFNELKRISEVQQDILSSKTASVAQKAVAKAKQLYALQRYVFRTLNTLDNTQMAVAREWKLAYYSSIAFKEAGLKSNDISNLIDAMEIARRAAYERAIDAGLDKSTARVRANSEVTDAVHDFVANKTDESTANKVLEAAEKDTYSVVGRRAPGIKEFDEGKYSQWMNFIMEKASEARGKGGAWNIAVTSILGMINIPFRTMRYFSAWHPYGLLRYGIHKYRTNRGLETHWKQSFANELQARAQFRTAIAGTIALIASGAWAALHSTSDDDAGDESFGFYVTGAGPTNRALKDAWNKRGFKPYSINFVINGRVVAIPITRAGEALMMPLIPAAAHDDYQWKKKEAAASGKEIPNPVSAYVGNLIAEHMYMTGQRGLFQSVGQLQKASEGGGGWLKNVARQGASVASASIVPFKQMLASFSEMLFGPMDSSSAESIVANSIPIIGLPFQKRAVNRFGDEMYDRSWYGIIQRTGIPVAFQVERSKDNERLYPLLVEKGIAPPELRRYVVEEKYGPLSDSQFNDFARKSGALLKQSAVSNLNDIQRMSPTEAKRFLQNAAERADKTAAAALGLERREKPQAATTTSPAASAPAPAASATSSASTSTGGGGSSRASASGRIRKSLASFKVPRLKKAGGRIRSRISRGFKRIKAKTGRIRGRISYRRRMPRIRYAI